eukprot:361399-Chlamydomonas_euryale.AAC.12
MCDVTSLRLQHALATCAVKVGSGGRSFAHGFPEGNPAEGCRVAQLTQVEVSAKRGQACAFGRRPRKCGEPSHSDGAYEVACEHASREALHGAAAVGSPAPRP